jgi:hypothetical protein
VIEPHLGVAASVVEEPCLLVRLYDMVNYPERFAQEALGHNSKAVHRAYAKRALVKIPSLEEYEKRNEKGSEKGSTHSLGRFWHKRVSP